MDNWEKLLFWSIGALFFAAALEILIQTDKIMEKEYRQFLYADRYFEIHNSRDK